MPDASRQRTPWPVALLMVSASCAAVLALAEISLRLVAGELTGRPSLAGEIQMVGGLFPATHDPELGHVPTPGYRGSDNPWKLPVAITSGGVRSNGRDDTPSGRPILAVGDSFTFGDEVGDSDTWPAQLEARVGRPVVNGGVFGYGLDQIVLRAERLLEDFDADTVVLGLIFDDVIRTEYAYRYAWKPWFEVVNDALVLRGTPVPEPGEGFVPESALRRAFQWSFVVDRVFRRLDPEGWLLPSAIRAHADGQRVSLLLIDRLASLAHERGLRVLVVLQWVTGQSSAPARPAVDRARSLGLSVLDVEPLLRELIDSGEARLDQLFHLKQLPDGNLFVGHMTARGNGVVAAGIARWVLEGNAG